MDGDLIREPCKGHERMDDWDKDWESVSSRQFSR